MANGRDVRGDICGGSRRDCCDDLFEDSHDADRSGRGKKRI